MNLTVTGAKEVDDVLRGLPQQLNHRVMQAAHADASKPLIQTAKNLAPVGATGNLRNFIRVNKPTFKRAGVVGEIFIGPRRGKYKGHAAHLIEYGKRNRGGKGRTAPRPFMEPAFNMTKGRVLGGINDSIGRKLYSFMKRTIKKYA